MGKITFNKIGGLGESENTACEYDNEIEYELLKNKLKIIMNALNQTDGYVCYILGMGAQSKNTYEKIEQCTGIDLIWVDSIMPKYLFMLNWLVASYAGLIKVNNIKIIKKVFLVLVEQSMAGIYFFPIAYEKNFVDLVKKKPMPKEYDFGIKKYSNYFYYIVDADNSESSTGIYEIVSYGNEAKYISELL